ncbi:sialic acid-binding Ig-like lectin 5 [Channa argus]|uniref:sialic acid-binding Ig-like lectin 5 n=1 Tax=Channa argus TaxID=215402 RepID=UPI00351FACC5
MKVFIWATLLFSVRSSNADTGASLGRPSCHNNSCISLIEGVIKAEAGLCVVIPCSFSTDPGNRLHTIVWFRCEASKRNCNESDKIFHSKKKKKNVQSEFRERVSLLEPEMSQNNCSIIINDLKESDSGSYWVRVKSSMPGRQSGSQQVTVSVKGLSQKPTVMIPPLTEGHQATLTCTAPGLCSGSVPEITWTWRRAGVNDSHITGNITDFKTENLTAVTQRHSSTLTFDPSAEHHGTEVTCKVRFTGNMMTEKTVTLNVSYVKEVKITGKTSVKEGETLNLTCSVESFPPSFVMWTKLSEQNMQNRTEANRKKDTEPQKQTGMAALSISNVTADHSGQYICTAKHLNNTLKKQVTDVTVTFGPKILNDSRCVNQLDVLTCVCISEGLPLPTIKWPLLENHTEYSVTTTVSNHTVNSSIRLSLMAQSKTTFECVSSNDNGQTKHNLSVKNVSQQDVKDHYSLTDLSTNIYWLQVIPAFLIGILLSATITCSARKCIRKKQSSVNLTENVEMVTTQAVPLVDADQAIVDDITRDQQAAEGAEAAWPLAPGEDNVNPKEVEYTDIDVSKLKRKSPTEDKGTQKTRDSEYAEIKKEKTMDRQNNVREESEMLVVYEEAAVVIGDKESEQVIQAEVEGGEDMALYSNVNEIMGRIYLNGVSEE